MAAKSKSSLLFQAVALASSLILAGVLAVACSSGSSSAPPTTAMASATVMLSDPATCAGPTGPYAHVYVTITDVQANTNSSAGDNDSGWNDLTPGLSSAPKQIDLLGQANNQCFLASLGASQQLQAGNYQQIRLILADNSATIANNMCNGSTNCVVLTSDSSVHTLQLSSESKTGLKIPSGQIAAGGFNIAAGQTKDLDIDFNTCASIVVEGNGEYRLKPVLHAGEVSTTSTSINGRVLDQATGNPLTAKIAGSGNPVIAQALVALERKDASGVDRIVMSTLTASDGTFVFCPIPSGTYDVVILGIDSNGTAFQPAIITGVSNGQTVGTVSLNSGPGTTTSTVQLSGGVTTQSSASQPTVADVAVSALETAGGATYTIPLLPNAQQPSAVLSLETAASSTCAAGTDCATYNLLLPAGGPYVGAYSASGASLTQSAPLATYVVDGLAFVPSSGGVADCSPAEQKTTPNAVSAGGATLTIQPLAFTQCQ